MSFLSVFNSISGWLGTATAVVAPVAPAIEAIPTFGPVFATVFNGIIALEQLTPASDLGYAKKSALTTLVNAIHPAADKTSVSDGIDAIVGALNLLHKAGEAMSRTDPASK